MIGIYAIRNTKDGKVYVGQSKSLKHRKNCHLYDLKNKRHSNRHLQEAYNQSPNDFAFEILAFCDEQELDAMERHYIEKLKAADRDHGYNIDLGGSGSERISNEHKAAIAKSKIGNRSMCGISLSDDWKRHLSESQPHKRKIMCVETGEVYDSAFDAARETGLGRSHIVSCCTGQRKTCGGLHWEYYERRPA